MAGKNGEMRREERGERFAKATYQLLLAADLNYGDTSHLQHAADEVDKLLNAYSRAIERNRTS